MLEILKDPNLQKCEVIEHGFFTRRGGVSTGYYASLNCAYPSQDNKENIRENIGLAMLSIKRPFETFVTLKNVHGNQVVLFEGQGSCFELLGDAMVTKEANFTLGTSSADCPIILFADEKAKVVGLAHAGWRGAKLGVIEATLEKMIEVGASPHMISASIGPCISQESYEVGLDFYQQFLNDKYENQTYFKTAININKKLFDLRGFVRDKLLSSGLLSVSEVNLDTYRDEERFFSCRRATHRGEPDFGGHLSFIHLR